MRLNDMQVEVFRRAIERRQDDLKGLAKEKATIFSLTTDRLASKSLPTLPNEVIAHIFSSLYFMEEDIYARTPACVALEDTHASTTLQWFLDDSGTSDSWRRIIQRHIPGVFTGDGEDDFRRLLTIQEKELLGPHPRILPTDDLDAQLSGSSTTVFTSVTGWPELKDKLHDMCKYPWRNLIISTNDSPSRVRRMEIMNSLVQNFGHKLANIERLEVYPFRDDGAFFSNLPMWGPLEVVDFDDQHVIEPKIRAARLPLHFLQDLRPFLKNATELEVGIPSQLEDLTSGFGVFADYLRPYADTLVDLKLSDVARDSRWRFWLGAPEIDVPTTPFPKANDQGRPILFPQLKRLRLNGFAECILLDVLSTFVCPSLSELSVSLGWYVPEDERRNRRVSAASLHKIHPLITCIDICPHDGDIGRNDEFFEALAIPDAVGNWLFPGLEVIRFDRKAFQSSTLKTLTRVVIARSSCSVTMPIRSVTFHLFETQLDAFTGACMSALKLLVPDVKCTHIVAVHVLGRRIAEHSDDEDEDL